MVNQLWSRCFGLRFWSLKRMVNLEDFFVCQGVRPVVVVVVVVILFVVKRSVMGKCV